jgi:putative transposase
MPNVAEQPNAIASYYEGLGKRVFRAIDKLFTKYPFFGSRQIAAWLARDGIKAGRHRVRRLMRLMGLEAVYKRPKTSQPHPAHPVFPYLLKGMEITRPNQVWCSDITFDGKSILDRFLLRLTPRQSGIPLPRCHHGLGHQKSPIVARVKHHACRLLCRCPERGHREIWPARDHEYGSGKSVHRVRLDHHANRRACARLDGRSGPIPGQYVGFACLRLIERLWRSLKYEAVYLQDIADGFAAQRVVDDWINFYNQERPHAALGKATPNEAYGATNELKKAA